MTRMLAPITALLVATAILLIGQGLQGTLVPVRGRIEGFSDLSIGLLGSFYFAGFVLGCLIGPYMVRRVGHIRSFAALAAAASAAPLAHAIFLNEPSWVILRMITGFCFAGLYMVIESWLNERATNTTRGAIMSAYTVINLTALIGGQWLLTVDDPAGFVLFALSSILLSVALVPVSLTSAVQPPPITGVKLRLGHLYRTSPVGLVGALAVGLANGTFWTLAPVFAQDRGFDVPGIAAFMTAVILGGALAQWPLGRLSDGMDRRKVIAAACLIASITGVMLFATGQPGVPDVLLGANVLLLIAFVFGAFSLPIYAICVAHMNDQIDRSEFVEASGGLLLAYGIGAIAGPFLASLMAELMGMSGIFAFTAIIMAFMTGFTLYRISRKRAPSSEEKDDYVGVPRSTPEVYALDPRSENEGEDDRKTTREPVSGREAGTG
jgi:MFS family permease